MLGRAFAWMDRHGAALLAVGVFIGLASQDLAALCHPLVGPSVFVLLTATVLRLEWRHVFARLRAPAGPFLIVAGLLVGMPLAMSGAVAVLEPPLYLRTPLVLLAGSPPLISVPAFALILGLDAPLALVVMVAAILLQPLIQPPVALALLGLKLEVGLAPLMERLGLFVGGAFALAAAIQAAAGSQRVREHGPAIGGVGILMLILFAIGVMDGLRAQLLAEPGRVLAFLGAVFAANFGMQAVAALVFWVASPLWRMSGREGLTAALAAGNRNIATLIAVLGPAADPDLFLFLACNQVPMYLVPALAGPAYRALLKVLASA